MSMHLFQVHCGFYENDIGDGTYEGHANFFVVAQDWKEARLKAKENPVFIKKHMHIDSLLQINTVNGFKVELTKSQESNEGTSVKNYSYEDMKQT